MVVYAYFGNGFRQHQPTDRLSCKRVSQRLAWQPIRLRPKPGLTTPVA
jgi:hypothetical protein